MPNVINEILFDELTTEFKDAGSCLVLSFDAITVEEVNDLRSKLRESGVNYKVVKNRLAAKAFASALDVDLTTAFDGKCGVVLAPEEGAISAAKLVREFAKANKPPRVRVTGGVIEGEAIVGDAATTIADMPDRDTVRTQIAIALSGPARGLATALNGVAGGLARCIQAKIDKEDS